MSSSESDAEAARAQVLACEKEISSIKAQLRAIASSGSEGGQLEVAWTKVGSVLHECIDV